jgi:hypothetical protein
MTLKSHLSDALRLSFWRAPRTTNAALSQASIVLIFVGAALATVAEQFFLAGATATFALYGVNSILAAAAVSAGLIVCFASVDRSPATLRNLVLLHVCAVLFAIGATKLESALVNAIMPIVTSHGLSNAAIMTIFVGACLLLPILTMLWVAGAARQIFRGVAGVRRPTLRAFAFAGCSFLAALALPSWPIFAPADFNRVTANYWEFGESIYKASAQTAAAEETRAAAKAAEQKAARLEGQQPARVEAALAAVEPRDAEKSNIFMVGVSGYSEQDVFAHETEQSLSILKSRFDIGNRVVRLVNDDNSTELHPIASIQNLSQVLHGLGARMDREKDVLILTMTSHGSPEGFSLLFDELFSRTLDPQTLKAMLDEAGIKNRILIVSSCYSGTFIPELANDDTMILTAASATRTSFGCANGRKWTYFGEALFDHGLKEKTTLAEAFATARKTVGQWETEQNITPSDPRISVGEAIAKRFPALVGPPPAQVVRQSEAEHASAQGERVAGAN